MRTLPPSAPLLDLDARDLPCPHTRCGGVLTFYFPINSFDVAIRPFAPSGRGGDAGS